MPIHIQDFPTELLAAVFENLPKSTLKRARLTSTRWSDIGAETLFQRVYFAPRRHTMQRFINITSHPVFSRTIKEVVYDGALFQSRYLDETIFREHCEVDLEPAEHDDEELTCCCANLSLRHQDRCSIDATSLEEQDSEKDFAYIFGQYKRLLAEQEEILSLGEDLEALHLGLKHASRITKVSLLDYFPTPDYLPLSDVSHAWYCNYLHSNYPGVLAPALWDGWSNMHLDETPDTYEGHDWDCRGINHLFEAVSSHCNRISELRIGSSISCAPLKLFHPSSSNTHPLKAIVKNLTSLQLHCGRNPRASATTLNEELLNAATILAETPQLETLSISLSAVSRRWIHIIQIPTWPRLQTLDLGDLNFTLPSLISVIENSRHTLRRLQFRNIWLEGGPTWITLAEKLGEMLKLEQVTLLGLVSDRRLNRAHVRDMHYEETPDLAKRMMAWVDPRFFDEGRMRDMTAAVVMRVRKENGLNTQRQYKIGF